MYSILVVEDEPLERKALVRLIEPFLPVIDEILETGDGDEALRLARHRNPDILLMDINIPGQSGLDVIKTLRLEGYRGEIVIVSAYNQFEYAKTALKNNVANYLLKPVDRCELETCLNQIFSALEQSRHERGRIQRLHDQLHAMNSYIHPLVLDALLSGRNPEDQLIRLYEWPTDGHLLAFLLRYSFHTPVEEEDLRCFVYEFCAVSQPYYSVIAAPGADSVTFAMQSSLPESSPPARAELLLWCITVRVAHYLRSAGHLYTLRASQALTHYNQFPEALPGKNDPFPSDPPLQLHALHRQTRQIPGWKVQLSKAVTRLKSGAPDKAFSVFKSAIQSDQTREAGLFLLSSAVAENNPGADPFGAIFCAGEDNDSLSSLFEWVRENAPASAATDTASSFVISLALDIIQDEYSNPMLSQGEIAERLGLSQAYFSRLFKREVGNTFIATLTQTRLDRAKELLAEGYSSTEVASRCGYQSKKYFYDAFRQNCGITVAQYLEQNNIHKT